MTFPCDIICMAGPSGEQEPVEVVFGARRVPIAEVVDRWFGEDYRYFKVRGRNDATYILRHNATIDVWEMTLYQRAHHDAKTTGDDGPGKS